MNIPKLQINTNLHRPSRYKTPQNYGNLENSAKRKIIKYSPSPDSSFESKSVRGLNFLDYKERNLKVAKLPRLWREKIEATKDRNEKKNLLECAIQLQETCEDRIKALQPFLQEQRRKVLHMIPYKQNYDSPYYVIEHAEKKNLIDKIKPETTYAQKDEYLMLDQFQLKHYL